MNKIFFALFFFHRHAFAVACFLLFTFHVFAQSITWQRLYDGPFHFYDAGYDVCQISNGDFVIVGSTWQLGPYVLRINAFGDTVWTRWFNLPGITKTVVSTNDGGFVFSGHGDRAYTIKLDSNGNTVWQKFYGEQWTVQIEDMRKTQDGGYVACGRDLASQTSNGHVFKIDSLGNLQWQVSHPGIFKQYSSIEEAFNSGYFLWGTASDYPGTYLTRISNSGAVIWERPFQVGDSFAAGPFITKISQGYLIGGGVAGMSPGFMRADTGFNVYFATGFKSNLNEGFDAMAVVNANRYVLSLYIDSVTTQFRHAKGLVADSLGNIIREKVFPSISSSHFYSIVPIANGDLLFAGYWRNHSAPPFDDIYAARTDSLLNVPPNFIGINPQQNEIPIEFKLYQNYPNPFNPTTKIKFDVPLQSFVTIKIYDVLGREMVFLINDILKEGTYEITWDATGFASGVYFVMLIANGYGYIKKMVLIK